MKLRVYCLLGATLLPGCVREPPQLQQCRDVIEHYVDVAQIVSVEEVPDADGLDWRFKLQVRSALGPQEGKASCHYPLDALGRVAERPDRIILGKTVFTSGQDLKDLLALEAPDLPAHPGH